MEPGTAEWTAVMTRLERLEKQNRRMKQIGAMALVLVGSVLAMGQASPKRIGEVEANAFILRDAISGNVRGQFDVTGYGPELVLIDRSGKRRVELRLSEAMPSLTLLSSNEKAQAMLSVLDDLGVQLGLKAADENARVLLTAGGSGLFQPRLEVEDKEGFQATVGSANLVTTRTGESHKTSAALVLLFDKEKKVLWKAP